VVSAAIFNSRKKVTGLLEQLEIHYLSNPDSNLYFALLGDFTDAPAEKTPATRRLSQPVCTGDTSCIANMEIDFFIITVCENGMKAKKPGWVGKENGEN
jgi:hypothetical protein